MTGGASVGAQPGAAQPAAGQNRPSSVAEVAAGLAAQGYLADEGLATSVFLSLTLHRPLLLEGEAGVGKTELAKVLAAWTGGRLLRLQCYEGIDISQAVYEWDYARQLLHLRAAEAGAGGEGAGGGGDAGAAGGGGGAGAAGAAQAGGAQAGGAQAGGAQAGGAQAAEAELYSERFLIRRPLLLAIDHTDGPPPVLLIDEVDRADDEFEAFLLEVLSDYTITIPEIGTLSTDTPPVVILTSNRTRDVHDALKRRCLYHWVEHPSFEREVEIVRRRAPHAVEALARQVAAAVAGLREMHLYKPPGVAETIDWTTSLAALGRTTLDEKSADLTLGTVLKYQEDQTRVREAGLEALVAGALARSD